MKIYFPHQKKSALWALAITAIVCSRGLFALFNDPEGPNLLIVLILATFIYLISLSPYAFSPLTNDSKKLWIAVLLQIMLTAALYVLEPWL